MTTLYIIRHGETDWNKEERIQGIEDIELNEMGIEQAYKCGVLLKNTKFDVIISSPLKRAYKTASIIAEQLQLPDIQIIEELQERDFGKASGLTRQQRDEQYLHGDIPDLEQWDQFRDRVMNGIQQILDLYSNKKILVIAHGGVINALLHTITEGEKGTGITILHNACLNIIHFKESNKWEIEKYNCINHLQ